MNTASRAPRYSGGVGYGHSSKLHTAKILRLSEDLPLVVEIVDSDEHIEEFLHHHGEANGDSTRKRVDREMARARAHSLGEKKFPNRDIEEDKTRAAFFYASLMHHGR